MKGFTTVTKLVHATVLSVRNASVSLVREPFVEDIEASIQPREAVFQLRREQSTKHTVITRQHAIQTRHSQSTYLLFGNHKRGRA
mgnify:CR=1 FL=1